MPSRTRFVPAVVLCVIFLFPAVAAAQAGRILYLYDDLNRLVRVIRQDGESATYHYDPVGNLLRVTRESGVPHTTTVSTASGTTLARAQTRQVVLTGFNFSGATVTASTGLTVTRIETDVDRLVVHVSVSGAAPIGSGTLTVRTPYGTVDVPVTVAAQTPTLTALTPAKLIGGMVLTVTGADLDGGGVGTTEVAVNGTAATVLSVTPTTITARVPAAAATGPVSVTTVSGTGTSATDLVVRTLGARRSHVPTTDLLAYWTFDVDGQDDADSRDLGLEGGLAATANGAMGRALAFNGNPIRAGARPVNDADFNFGASDFSLSLWARWNTLDDTGAQVLVEKLGASGGWSLIKTSSTVLFSPWFGTAPGTIVAGRWYHVAVVRQAGTATIYLNGAMAAQADVSTRPLIAVTDPLRLGERTGAETHAMNGVIDELGLWSRALSASEVAALASESDLLGPEAMSDAFTGTVIEMSKWDVTAPLGNSTVTQNDALLATNDGTTGTFATMPGLFGPGAGVGSRCVLTGNFDVDVRFRGFSAGPGGFTQAFVGLYQDGDNQLHVKRILGPGANGIQTVYKRAGVLTSAAVTPFTDAAGRLRITRTDGRLVATFFETAGAFQTQLGSSLLFGGDLFLSLVLLGPEGTTSAVEYDDLVVNSGAVLCPVTP